MPGQNDGGLLVATYQGEAAPAVIPLVGARGRVGRFSLWKTRWLNERTQENLRLAQKQDIK